MELVALLLFILGAMAGRWIAPRRNSLWILAGWSGVWMLQFLPWLGAPGRYFHDYAWVGLIASTIILAGGWTGYGRQRLVLWRNARKAQVIHEPESRPS